MGGAIRREFAAASLVALAGALVGCGGGDTKKDEVAVAPNGQPTMSLVARIDQNGRRVTSYGYLNAIHGLPSAGVFSSPTFDKNPTAARFTFTASATIGERDVVNNVIATESDGTLDVYLQAARAADPKNPASFSRGKLVASYRVHLQNIITVVGPNRGVATATGQLEQRQAQRFDVPGGKGKRFGRTGFVSRLSLNGAGTRNDATLPRASLAIAGSAIAASGS